MVEKMKQELYWKIGELWFECLIRTILVIGVADSDGEDIRTVWAQLISLLEYNALLRKLFPYKKK